MSDNFQIDIRGWLPDGEGADPVARTNAEIFIGDENHCATEVQDRRANTVRQTIRVSAYLLAEWLVANWWRLTLEPERERPGNSSAMLDWKLSHQFGAIGGGYLWPPLTLDSDQFRITVRSSANTSFMPADLSPVRYLNTFQFSVTVAALENAIVGFVVDVISRLDALNLRETPLHLLWREVSGERVNARLREVRQIEALLGMDPDTNDQLAKEFLKWKRKAGDEAVREIAAGVAENPEPEIFKRAETAVQSIHTFARIESFNDIQSAVVDVGNLAREIPWELGKKFAETLRKIWHLRAEPVKNRKLAELLNVNENVFESYAATPFTLGVRGNAENQLKLVLREQMQSQGRRFEVARLLGDFLLSNAESRWLPVTSAMTARQKFQRAFAAEFLCPSDALKERFEWKNLDQEETESRISETAVDFDVSTLVIRHHLENRNIFPTSA